MDDNPLPQLVLFGALRCAALGLAVGALDAVFLAATARLWITPVEFFVASGLAVVVMGALGFVAGVVLGFPLHAALARLSVYRSTAVQVAAVTLLLMGTYFWQFAWDTIQQGRAGAALYLAAIPIFASGVSFLFASAFFKRAYYGAAPPVGITVAGPVLAPVAVLIAGGLFSIRDTGGLTGLPSDPNVVVVTVGGLRADHVQALAGDDAPPTPAFDGLAERGALFSRALSPAPTPRQAAIGLLAGRYPIMLQVTDETGHHPRGYPDLVWELRQDGFATAAFVADPRLGGEANLAQHFHVFDDDIGAPLPALYHLFLGRSVLAWNGGRAGQGIRSGPDTVARFRAWLDVHADRPFFAWIHLAEPAAPFEPHGLPGFEGNGRPGAPVVDHAALGPGPHDRDTARRLNQLYDEEVVAADRALGEVVAALQERGLDAETMVIAAGLYGADLGEHGHFGHTGLWESVIGVPLVASWPQGPRGERVDAQVRLTDVFATVLAFLGISDPEKPGEGFALQEWVLGVRTDDLQTPLFGEGRDGALLLGFRGDWFKYVRRYDDGRELAFSVDADPDEQRLVNEVEATNVEQVRGNLAPYATMLRRMRPGEVGLPKAVDAAGLEALGYTRTDSGSSGR